MAEKLARVAVSSEYTPVFANILAWLPPAVLDIPAKRPFLYLCLRVAVLLGMFIVVDRFIMRASHLPAASYEQPYLFLELLKRLGTVWVGCMAVLGIVLIRYGTLLRPWNSLEHGRQLRWFVVFLAAVMAWPFTTYGFNHYFDQGHYADRALLAIMVALIWFRPVFIYPFLFLAFTIMWQLSEPSIGGTILAHKLQVLHVLTLFAAAFLIHAATGGRRSDGFFFFTCCLVAAAYWEPALAKIELNWLSHGHLYLIPLAAYAHGWLAFLEPPEIVAFAQAVSWFDWPLLIAVLVVETGCLFFLWRRPLSVWLLVAVMTFHLGVFVLYGFLFWTWILLDAALLVILIGDLRTRTIPIYTRGHLGLSILLIGFAGVWTAPAHLGWYDTRLSYTYRLEAISVSGKQYPLPPRFFAPYEDRFTMASFGYLAKDHRVLVGPYGVTRNRAVADGTMMSTTPDEVFALESKIGPRRYKAARADRFYEFVTRYVANWNANGRKAAALYALHPPRQFWSFGRGEIPPDHDPLREVIVREITTLFDGNELNVIREIELARLQIPAERKN